MTRAGVAVADPGVSCVCAATKGGRWPQLGRSGAIELEGAGHRWSLVWMMSREHVQLMTSCAQSLHIPDACPANASTVIHSTCTRHSHSIYTYTTRVYTPSHPPHGPRTHQGCLPPLCRGERGVHRDREPQRGTQTSMFCSVAKGSHLAYVYAVQAMEGGRYVLRSHKGQARH